MFNLEHFKDILENTSKLIESSKQCKKDDEEEIKMKIDSNVLALKRIIGKIDDEETKNKLLKTIESLSLVPILTELNSIKQRKKAAVEKNNDVVDSELLKNTLTLKKMAQDFSECLKEDRKALDKANSQFARNAEQSSQGLRILTQNTSKTSVSFILSTAFIFFIVMYLIIRFL